MDINSDDRRLFRKYLVFHNVDGYPIKIEKIYNNTYRFDYKEAPSYVFLLYENESCKIPYHFVKPNVDLLSNMIMPAMARRVVNKYIHHGYDISCNFSYSHSDNGMAVFREITDKGFYHFTVRWSGSSARRIGYSYEFNGELLRDHLEQVDISDDVKSQIRSLVSLGNYKTIIRDISHILSVVYCKEFVKALDDNIAVGNFTITSKGPTHSRCIKDICRTKGYTITRDGDILSEKNVLYTITW